MASTLSTFDFALKEWYTKDRIESVIFSDRPWLGMIKKETEFQGRGHPVPVLYRAPQGVAVSLADAQSNATSVVGTQFMVTAGDVSASVDIGDKVIKASRANPGAFLQNKKAEIDNLYELVSDTLAIALAGNGGQSLGQRASISSNTITLLDKADVHKFHVGMVLVASANDGSDASHALRTGSAAVTAVDLAAGTVTVDNAAGITSFANSDHLFRRGMFFGDTAKFVMHGVQSYVWTHASAPPAIYSSGSRTADRVRLAGMAVPAADLTGKGIEERIQILGSRLTGRGMAPGADCYFLNPEDWQNLAIALQSRGQRSLTDDSTKFGYKYLSVIAGAKEAKVFADRYFPSGVVFGLKKDVWTLFSLEELIHALKGDGLEMLRKSSTNDYEYRLVSYPGLGCSAPGHNGRAPL
jgi:hypothetical protein